MPMGALALFVGSRLRGYYAYLVPLGAMFVGVYIKGRALLPEQAVSLPDAGNTQSIGLMLYGNYMFAFEIASLLLLVAIIGAVVMAKKRM